MKQKTKKILSALALTSSLCGASFSQNKNLPDSLNKKVELVSGSIGKMLGYGDFAGDVLIQKSNSFTFGGMISNYLYNDRSLFSKVLNIGATAGYWSNRDSRLRLFSSDAGTISLGLHAYGSAGPSIIYKTRKYKDEISNSKLTSHAKFLAGFDFYSAGNDAMDKLSESVADKHAFPPISLYFSGSFLYQPFSYTEKGKKQAYKLKELGGQLGLRIWLQK